MLYCIRYSFSMDLQRKPLFNTQFQLQTFLGTLFFLSAEIENQMWLIVWISVIFLWKWINSLSFSRKKLFTSIWLTTRSANSHLIVPFLQQMWNEILFFQVFWSQKWWHQHNKSWLAAAFASSYALYVVKQTKARIGHWTNNWWHLNGTMIKTA